MTGNACKEIGPVFDRVDCGSKPLAALVIDKRARIVPGSGKVESSAPTLFEKPNFISELHMISGLGVRPALTVRRA